MNHHAPGGGSLCRNVPLSWNLEVQVDEAFQDQMQEDWLRQAVQATLVSEGISHPAELSLFVTDDEEVRKLNWNYRGVDQTTDVLAFAFREDVEGSAFPQPPDGVTHLGEVIISCPQAARQASEQGHSLKQELTLLAVHGVLHLLEYDHESPEEEQAMRAREVRILSGIEE